MLMISVVNFKLAVGSGCKGVDHTHMNQIKPIKFQVNFYNVPSSLAFDF